MVTKKLVIIYVCVQDANVCRNGCDNYGRIERSSNAQGIYNLPNPIMHAVELVCVLRNEIVVYICMQ